MKDSYRFEYMDENKFRVRERSVRKYNMLAYKKLTFEYYPQLKEGNFLGKMVKENEDHSMMYELMLPTDDPDKKIILLTNITPDGILDEGHRSELTAYKGVMISKSNPKKDMFKVNLLNMMNKGIGNSYIFMGIVSVLLILGLIFVYLLVK